MERHVRIAHLRTTITTTTTVAIATVAAPPTSLLPTLLTTIKQGPDTISDTTSTGLLPSSSPPLSASFR